MKKCWIILLVALLLSGCGAQETFETVSDDYPVAAATELKEVQLSLPDDAAAPLDQAEDGSKIYMCDGYTITVQTMESGDLDRTFREISGYPKEELTVMKTMRNGIDCYESVWCTAGEEEEQICRSVIFDDGNYHYGITVMANYSMAGQLSDTWQDILGMATLVSTD